MTRVSLSGLEKPIAHIWEWHQRAAHGLRQRLADERAAASPSAGSVFYGLGPAEVDAFFAELDFLSMLDLMSATEAAVRVDFWRRVHGRDRDALSRRFRDLAKVYEDRVSLEEHVLDARVAERPDVRSPARDFKGALRLRNWLAHGRYWTPKLARQSYTPADVYDVCDRLLRQAGLA
jgi:hypothetical protein